METFSDSHEDTAARKSAEGVTGRIADEVEFYLVSFYFYDQRHVFPDLQ